MQNVPWYEEVVKYAEAVCAFLPGEYEIACAHKHSCLVLIANKRYWMKTKVTSKMADEEAEAVAEDRPVKWRQSGSEVDSKGGETKKEGEGEEEEEGEYAWHTWIDYPKWTQLVMEWHRTKGTAKFSKLDYVARTPSWALYGAEEAGFSPYEVHFKRSANGRTVTNERSGKAEDIARATTVGVEDYENENEGGCG